MRFYKLVVEKIYSYMNFYDLYFCDLFFMKLIVSNLYLYENKSHNYILDMWKIVFFSLVFNTIK